MGCNLWRHFPGWLFHQQIDELPPGGYFQIRRLGGLGPHIKLGGKIWGKVRPSSQNKRKNLGSSVTKRRKSWEKVPILGSYLKFRGQNLGYLSFIFLEAKFAAPTRISEAKFGAKPPRPPNMEVPPWGAAQLSINTAAFLWYHNTYLLNILIILCCKW